ncbi:hypothetical protein TNCV_3756051 [Trichonephila clavipes]|nr:hypothetical protein TNCV_3756051 [Trichonephila clavipes]
MATGSSLTQNYSRSQTSQYPVFPAGCSQRGALDLKPGIKASLCKTAVERLPGNSSSKHNNVDALWRHWSTFLMIVLLVWNLSHNQRTTFGPLVTVEPLPLETGQLQAYQWRFISRNHLND